MLTANKFQQAAGLNAGLAARWFPHIDAAMKEFGISSPVDQSMFIAQVQLYFLLWGQEKIGVMRHNSIICTDGAEVRGEALEEITVVGVITRMIARHWDR